MNILKRWDINVDDLTKIIDDNPSLRGMLLGYVAAFRVHSFLVQNPHVTELRKDDDHDRRHKGDRTLIYKGTEFRIEIKSLQTNLVRTLDDGTLKGQVQCDASDRRNVVLPSGKTVNTTCLVIDEFDILAVNLFQFRGKWEFAFALNKDLPRTQSDKYTKSQRCYLLKTLIPISWPLQPPFVSDPFTLMDKLILERGCS